MAATPPAAPARKRDFNSPWCKQFWALFRNDPAQPTHKISRDIEALQQLAKKEAESFSSAQEIDGFLELIFSKGWIFTRSQLMNLSGKDFINKLEHTWTELLTLSIPALEAMILPLHKKFEPAPTPSESAARKFNTPPLPPPPLPKLLRVEVVHRFCTSCLFFEEIVGKLSDTYETPLPPAVVQMALMAMDCNVNPVQLTILGEFLRRHGVPYITPCAAPSASEQGAAAVSTKSESSPRSRVSSHPATTTVERPRSPRTSSLSGSMRKDSGSSLSKEGSGPVITPV